MHIRDRWIARTPSTAIAILGTLIAAGAAAQSVVPPLPVRGPHPVACSNVQQDFSRVPPGETASMFWDGASSGGVERYVTNLFVDPANALVTNFVVPNDTSLFARWSGAQVTYAMIVCYPTTSGNNRADYALPDGRVVPKMQRGAEAPILIASPSRLPVLLFSHGYGGSPLGDSYLDAVQAFASWGYVTAAPFHGDYRYSVFGPDNGDGNGAVYIPIWDEFVAMQATRPLSLSASLDVLAQHAHWRDSVDLGRVGAFGISQGGETLMLLGGAKLTYTLITLDSKRVTQDTRVRAAVGYVPYFGLNSLPAFGKSQEGADGLTLPYLAISGTDDAIAPANVTRAALDRMAGVTGQVTLTGQGHDLDPSAAGDIATWALGFLSAWVSNDGAAQAKLVSVEHVDGGLDDHKVLYKGASGSGSTGVVVDTIEYFSAEHGHYMITAFPEEAAMLDEGVLVPGWKRTGFSFPSWQAGTGPGNDACRFYGTIGRGPSSHFYTIDLAECEHVKTNPDWTYEALAFRAVEPLAGGCDAAYVPVTRLYNNGMTGEANHRYLTDRQEIERMIAKGWVSEGVRLCTPP